MGRIFRLPMGFLYGLALIVGVPLALLADAAIQAYFGTDTVMPKAAIIVGAIGGVVRILVDPFFRQIPNIGDGIFAVGFVFFLVGLFLIYDGYQGDTLEKATWYFAVIIGPAFFLFLPFLVIRYTYGLKELPKIRNMFSIGQGGNAMWAGPFTYEKLPDIGSHFLGCTLVQDTLLKRDVGLPMDDDAHFVTIAATGAGKSLTAISHNLRYYKHPIIVLDPKGEHTRQSLFFRKDGVVLDPYSRVETERGISARRDYNPLSEINIRSDNARALIQAISNGCVLDDAKDVHFSESAKTIIEGLIAHVLSTYPREEHTLPKVADLLRGFDDELRIADPTVFDAVVAEMSTNGAAGGLPMDAANLLAQAGDRERGSMLTTCFRSLKWINDPPMREHLSAEFHNNRASIKDIITQDGKGALYIVLPFEYMEQTSQIRWMRMLTALVNVLTFQNPRRSDQGKVMLVLDEFRKLGYMPALEEGIVTARGAGLKYWVLLQDIGQLQQLYDRNWETFLGSSNIQVFGIQDQGTVDWVAKALGGQKEGQSNKYPLMRPDEVRQFLGKDSPTQIVIPATGLPMRLERLGWVKVKKFRDVTEFG